MIDYVTVWLINGKKKYLVSSNSVSLTKEIAVKLGIVFTDIVESIIPVDNGIFKAWTIGELADYLKEERK